MGQHSLDPEIVSCLEIDIVWVKTMDGIFLVDSRTQDYATT